MNDSNPLNRESGERQLVDAAQAAASWIRARRAVWNPSTAEGLPNDPPSSVLAPDLPAAVPFELPAFHVESPAPVADWVPPIPDENDGTAAVDPRPSVEKASAPKKARPVLSGIRSIRLPWRPMMLSTAAAVLVLAIGVGVKAYWRKGAATAKAAVAALDAAMKGSAASSRPPEPVRKTTGRLELISEPPGAQLILDGKARGVTPAMFDDLPPGTHQYELRSSEGTIRRSVVIKAGETAQVTESIYGGWLKVFAPFEVTIVEGARVARLEDGNQIMLPAGRHELHVVNRTLHYDSAHRVDIKPGETVTISVAPPSSLMFVNASVPAEVWIDGSRAGETPLVGKQVAVGTHDVLVRSSDGNERHSVVTVTVKPFTLDVDFSKP